MTSHPRGPVEVSSSWRRRASTANSTGLDYASCHRVDEDVLSRIRSLLLSRNARYPPRTPFTSDEHKYRASVTDETEDIDRFDFSTARSVASIAKLASSRTSRFSVSGAKRRQSKTDITSMDSIEGSRRPSDHNVFVPKRHTLRSTSSANDLKSLLDDAKVHEIELTCCPPCAPKEPKKKFRLPRLVLKDKEKPDMTIIKTCRDTFDLSCCEPPKHPVTEPSLSKPVAKKSVLVIDTIQPQSADFECFMAGCSPGPEECTKHRRRSSQLVTNWKSDTPVEQKLNSPIEQKGELPVSQKPKKVIRVDTNIRTVARDIAEDVAKLSLAIKDVKVKSPFLVGGNSELSETSDIENRTTPEPQTIKEGGKVEQANGVTSDPGRSPTYSTASSDAFPHVAISREIASKEIVPQSLSAAIITNFSLPGPNVQKSTFGGVFSDKEPQVALQMVQDATNIEKIYAKPSVNELPAAQESQIVDIIDSYSEEVPLPSKRVSQPMDLIRSTQPGSFTGQISTKPSVTGTSAAQESQALDASDSKVLETPVLPQQGSRRVDSIRSNQSVSPIGSIFTKSSVNGLSVIQDSQILSAGGSIVQETPVQSKRASQTEDLIRSKQSLSSLHSNSGPQPPEPIRAKLFETSLSFKIASSAKEYIRERQSDVSLKSKPKSPSLLSGASRSSASVRHSLLKPSVSTSSPVDTGLAVPPILTQIAVDATDKHGPLYDELVKGKAGNVPVPAASMGGHLTNLQKARDLVASVEQRIREASEALNQEVEYKNPCCESDQSPKAISEAPPGPAIDLKRSVALGSVSQSKTQTPRSVAPSKPPVDVVVDNILEPTSTSTPTSSASPGSSLGSPIEIPASDSDQSSKSLANAVRKLLESNSISPTSDPIGIREPNAGVPVPPQSLSSIVRSILESKSAPTEPRVSGSRKSEARFSPTSKANTNTNSKNAATSTSGLQKNPKSGPTGSVSEGPDFQAQPATSSQRTVPDGETNTSIGQTPDDKYPSSEIRIVTKTGTLGFGRRESCPQVPLPTGPKNVVVDNNELEGKSPEHGYPKGVDLVGQQSADCKRSDSPNAAYWGFVPAVKEAVQDAVQSAVRKAVHEIVVPPGSEVDEASTAYRKLVGDSLAQAAQNADEYLRRASLWNEPPPSSRFSESTVIVRGSSLKEEKQDTNEGDTAPDAPKMGRSLIPSAMSSGRTTLKDGSPRPANNGKNQENEGQRDVNPVKTLPPQPKSRESKSSTPTYYGQLGSVPANFETRGSLVQPSVYASPEHMETIPLEPVDETVAEHHKQSWKIPSPFKHGASPAYTAIPTRRSSRNHILKAKNSSANTSAKVSPSGIGSRRHSFERLRESSNRGLRSVSSHGSFKSSGSCEQRIAVQTSPTEAATVTPGEKDDVNSSTKEVLPEDKPARKNTVHWLRELLSSSGPYEPRLTELPPRTRREQNLSGGRTRSQTAPTKPVTELYLDVTSRTEELKKVESNFRSQNPGSSHGSEAKAEEKSAAVTANFTKTIRDLEDLLNEALFIARQAAEREDAGYAPVLLGNATAILKDGRKGLEDDCVKIQSDRGRVFSMAYAARRSSTGSIPSVHESLRSYSSDSDLSGERDKTENDVEISLYQQSPPKLNVKIPTIGIVVSTDVTQNAHSSGWPPTGRTLTPFPPGSAIASERGSSNASLVPAEDDGSSIDSIKELALVRSGSRAVGNDEVPEKATCPVPPSPNDRIKDIDPFGRVGTGRRESSRVSPGHSPERDGRSRATTVQNSQKPTAGYDERLTNEGGRGASFKALQLPAITPGASISRSGNELINPELIKSKFPTDSIPSRREVREYIQAFQNPPIQPRTSSLNLRKKAQKSQMSESTPLSKPIISRGHTFSWQNIDDAQIISPPQTNSKVRPRATTEDTNQHILVTPYSASFDGTQPSDALDFDTGYGHKQSGPGGNEGAPAIIVNNGNIERDGVELRDVPNPNLPEQDGPRRRPKQPSPQAFNLKGKHHVSLRGEHHKGFSLTRSHKRQSIARDWAPARKRFVASVACISTALVGILVGIYAAEVPAIQYKIVDFHHYTILGNVFFFIGLAIPTFFFWPLPLLHGRKPYISGAMCLAMPLLFPQALAVGEFRSPYIATWRVALILPRALMGFVLGFANMNFKSTLTDLFGASLQSANPHQEVVDENDVRRHGGGLGVWLGIWTWCSIGSIGLGFMIGAMIINFLDPAWGFYISIAIIAFVLFLNVLCPEVRRSAFRRSVAEAKTDDGVSRRLGRGEVKMHMVQSGPKWWGQEFHYGVMLSVKMLYQPGFLVMAWYVAWIYGQIVLIIVLLGSLMSKYYNFKSHHVGASVTAVPIGALLAIPFQKAGFFSRDRTHAEISDDDTRDKKAGWSSHVRRRALFVLCLPFAGLAYTLSSGGPPIPFMLPIIFAALIGFLSALAIAECHGIIMETFDTSDLQPGMTGRPRKSNNDKNASKRTNYSSFPRVASAFGIIQGLGYLIAAIATGVGGVAERHIGAKAASGVMAGILLILSLLLLGILVRFREVQIIPNNQAAAMEQWMNARRASAVRRGETNIDDDDLRPVIIGNPTHTTRRMCILEMGSMSRWSEIRRKNHLVDANSLEAKHPNLAVMRDVENRLKEMEEEVVHHVRRSLSRHSSRGSRRSRMSEREQLDSYRITIGEPADSGGHREMMSGNGLRRGGSSKKRRKTTIREGVEQ